MIYLMKFLRREIGVLQHTYVILHHSLEETSFWKINVLGRFSQTLGMIYKTTSKSIQMMFP